MIDNPIELFAQAMQQALEEGLSGLHVSMPGRVEEYDVTRQRAIVQPLLRRAHNAAGERVVLTLPPITNVPVITFRGGGFRFHLPVTKGDTVLLIFSEQSLDKWLQRGGIVDPQDDRRHHLTDAIAVPGLLDFANAWDGLTTDRATLGYEGQAQLEIFPNGEIHAGGTEPLVKRSEFLNHSHATAGTGVPSPPIVGGTPGSSVTFPGTGKLRG